MFLGTISHFDPADEHQFTVDALSVERVVTPIPKATPNNERIGCDPQMGVPLRRVTAFGPCRRCAFARPRASFGTEAKQSSAHRVARSSHRVSLRSIDCASREGSKDRRAKRHGFFLGETLWELRATRCALDCLLCRSTPRPPRLTPCGHRRSGNCWAALRASIVAPVSGTADR